MQVELKISEDYKEPKVVIYAARMTDEIASLMKQLSEDQPRMIAAFDGDTVAMLAFDEIYRVYASEGRVYAETKDKKYLIRLRLYELEERLSGPFVRISNSEIINLNKVKNFDLSFAGTICVSLAGGTVTYVSRRYVKKIKQQLGL
jgi:DNA-binding LytR/AlgR family response regulator